MSTKLYGSTGKLLRVDLSQGGMWEETLAETTLRKYFGGTCLGAKYVYDEVTPRASGQTRKIASLLAPDLWAVPG